MQRDMELIRQIAFEIEQATGDTLSTKIEIEGHSAEAIRYHCALMHEAGLIKAEPTANLRRGKKNFWISRLTSKGHDFVDAARNDTLWKKFTAKARETGVALTIEMTIAWLKQEAAERWDLGGTGSE
ncbi:MAG: DUF2513 domain-containing protein [Candidatus Paceibacterota bacterium]